MFNNKSNIMITLNMFSVVDKYNFEKSKEIDYEKELLDDIDYWNNKENRLQKKDIFDDSGKRLYYPVKKKKNFYFKYAYIKIYCDMTESTVYNIINYYKCDIIINSDRYTFSLKALVLFSHILKIDVVYEIDHFIIKIKLNVLFFENYDKISMVVFCNLNYKKFENHVECLTEISYYQTQIKSFKFNQRFIKTKSIILTMFDNGEYHISCSNINTDALFYICHYENSIIRNIDAEYITNNNAWDESNFDNITMELIHKNGEINKYESFDFYIDNIKYVIISFTEDIFDEKSFRIYLENCIKNNCDFYGKFNKNTTVNLITEKQTYVWNGFEKYKYKYNGKKIYSELKMTGYVIE